MLFTISIYGNAAVCDFFSLLFTFAYYIVVLYSYKDSIMSSLMCIPCTFLSLEPDLKDQPFVTLVSIYSEFVTSWLTTKRG